MRSFSRFCALLLLVLAGALTPAHAQLVEWAQSIRHSPSSDSILHLLPQPDSRSATNRVGTTVVTGSFRDSVRFTGGGKLGASAADKDVFVAVFNANGRLRWFRQLGSAAADASHAVAIDAADNVFVTISHSTTLVADTMMVNGPGTTLVKYNANGERQWRRQLSDRFTLNRLNPPYNEVNGIVTDSAGDCFLAGRANFQTAIAGVPTVRSLGNIGYVLRLSGQTGATVWLRQIPLESVTGDSLGSRYVITSLALDGRNNLVFAGSFSDTIVFGSPPGSVRLRATNVRNAFAASYTAGGVLRWARAASGSTSASTQIFRDVVADAAGHSYLVGYSTGAWRLGNLTVPTGGAMFSLDSAGAPRWGRAQPVDAFAVALASSGEIIESGQFQGAIALGADTLVARGVADGFVAACDAQLGAPRWGIAVGGQAEENLTDLDLGPGLAAYVYGRSEARSLNLGSATVLGPGTFLLRLSLTANRLPGTAYLDTNNNGYRNAGELPFPRPVLLTAGPANSTATTDPATGRFTAFTGTGPYDLRIPQAPTHYTIRQGASGYQGYFAAYGQVAPGASFGLVATPNQQDVRVTLTPYSTLRAGLPRRYRARLENVGTITVPLAQLAVTLGGGATIIGTVPASTSVGQTRTWDVPNLAPFAVRDFDVTFSLAVTTPVGTPLEATALVTPLTTDVVAADNLDTLQQVVTAAFDPNDLSVNHENLSLGQVQTGVPLDYLIRFENVGNDTAFAVTIVDSLPADLLQLGTLQLVGTSHNCQWLISHDGVLTLRFPGIRLPYQAIDALRSQGFVRFRVKPRPTLSPGTLIPGRAHITFDLNAPVPTNNVTTIVTAPVAGGELDGRAAEAAWSLYPNPATTTVTLAAEAAQPGLAAVRILDALGRPVKVQEALVAPGAVRVALDVRGLVAGLYAVRLTMPGWPPTVRHLVVR